MRGTPMTPDARPEVRVAELLATFDAADVDLGALLCDDHPADGVAFTVVQPDLTSVDISYGDLSERSRRFASFLGAEGVQPGDRVATLMGKSPELACVIVGIWRAGAVHVPPFPAFDQPPFVLRLGGSESQFVVAGSAPVTTLVPGRDLPAPPP